MKTFRIFVKSPAANLFVNDGLNVVKTVNAITEAAKGKGANVTFWNNGTVSICGLYMHTVKVPAKALRSLDDLKTWIINRINYYYTVDKNKFYTLWR